MAKQRVPRADYSKIAEYYDEVRPAPADIWVSKIIEYGKISADCTVLDVGCGTGRFPVGISAVKSPMICALDSSIEMLEQAVKKDKPRDTLWILGDGQNLPFGEGLFNCVYMTLVIHHIEDKERALREIYWTLKKNGNCVIMTNSHARIKRHALHDFPGVVALDLKKFPTLSSLKKLMVKVGFRETHHHRVQHDEYMPTENYLERVKNKYVSTLTLLSEEAFQRGFEVFQQRVRRKYGAQIKRHSGFDFIVGQK